MNYVVVGSSPVAVTYFHNWSLAWFAFFTQNFNKVSFWKKPFHKIYWIKWELLGFTGSAIVIVKQILPKCKSHPGFTLVLHMYTVSNSIWMNMFKFSIFLKVTRQCLNIPDLVIRFLAFQLMQNQLIFDKSMFIFNLAEFCI